MNDGYSELGGGDGIIDGAPGREPTDGTPSSPAQFLDSKTEATVDALLETVWRLLEEENSRDQSFNARGVGLAGFVGIVVSLSTTLGQDALAASWEAPWREIVVVLFAGALASLVGSVGVVILKVLRPRESASLGIAEVQKYPLPERIYAPKVMNQGSTMRGLIDALIIQRSRVGSKAIGLQWGYRLLLLGLLCISMLGFLLGLRDARLIGVQHARQTLHPAAIRCEGSRQTACADGTMVANPHATTHRANLRSDTVQRQSPQYRDALAT